MTDIRFKNILELNKHEKKEFVDSFDIVLSDCDGVLWMVIGPIPNAGAALNILKGAGKICHLISNNSMRPEKEYHDKLADMGVMKIDETQVITPVNSMIAYLKKIKMEKPIFTIANDNLNDNLKKAGFKVRKLDDKLYESVQDFSADLKTTDDKVGAVIFDIDINLNITKLDTAYRYLLDPDCLFLVGAGDAIMPLKQDLSVLGPESFINMLRKLTGKTPYVLGKPGVLLADYLFERFNIVDPSRILFIGDNLVQDIGFGIKNEFQTLLVLSGASKKEDAQRLPKERQPHYVANSIADFITLFDDFVN